MNETKNLFAFPLTDGKNFANDGMTLRDYFAAKAMQGFIIAWGDSENIYLPSDLAEQSYFLADSMLKQRNKNEK